MCLSVFFFYADFKVTQWPLRQIEIRLELNASEIKFPCHSSTLVMCVLFWSKPAGQGVNVI